MGVRGQGEPAELASAARPRCRRANECEIGSPSVIDRKYAAGAPVETLEARKTL